MIDVVEMVTEHKRGKIRSYPCRSNRASELGHPCLRYLVYQRTSWEKKALHNVGLQFIFDEGNLQENAVIRDLLDAGIQIVEQQRSYEWKEHQITGHIDLKIIENGSVIPTEVKSFNEWNWRSISEENGIQDMLNHRSIYMRKYPAQLTLYLLMDGQEEGMFISKNKSTGQLRQIQLLLDYDYAESLIKKAEAVNRHVAEQTLPERCSWTVGACDICPFAHICLPPVDRESRILNDPELETMLDRKAELKAAVSEHNAIDKKIKAAIKEIPEAVVGKWHILGSWVDRKGYTVQASQYWKTQIKPL